MLTSPCCMRYAMKKLLALSFFLFCLLPLGAVAGALQPTAKIEYNLNFRVDPEMDGFWTAELCVENDTEEIDMMIGFYGNPQKPLMVAPLKIWTLELADQKLACSRLVFPETKTEVFVGVGNTKKDDGVHILNITDGLELHKKGELPAQIILF